MLNDRFKFRVYKKAEHKMVYDVTYLNPQLLDSRINDNADNYVVMQSVNLRDYNGKLIYEGDVVALPYGNFIVKYCDECKQYQLFYNDMCYGCEGDIHWIEFVTDTETRDVKVIGNIYETQNIQELLEEW